MKRIVIFFSAFVVLCVGAWYFPIQPVMSTTLDIHNMMLQLAWLQVLPINDPSAGGGGSGCSGDYGFTTIGSKSDPGNDGIIVLYRISLGCSGTISSISGYMVAYDTPTHQLEFCIYADNGSGTDPAGLLGHYGQFYDSNSYPNPIWVVDSTVSQSITGDPSYIWVGWQSQEGDNCKHNRIANASSEERKYQGTWGTFPDPWPTASDIEENFDVEVYVTF